MAFKLAGPGRPPVFTIGPLIHNPQEVARLASLGIVPRDRLEECRGGITLVRTHGIGAEEVARAKELGLRLEDATCPHVELPRRHIQDFGRQGRTVLLLGDPGHPEVQALISYRTGPVHVIREPGDLPPLEPEVPMGLVAQTTQSEEAFARMASAARQRFPDLVIENTICKDARRRQEESQALAHQVDMMVVVGGRNSANTGQLAALCRAIQPRTFHVEVVEELRETSFDGVTCVGLISGASTPDGLIDEAEAWLRARPG
jgi:4-hydroxy-3-methylbut-2-enyl diphosphate reductase